MLDHLAELRVVLLDVNYHILDCRDQCRLFSSKDFKRYTKLYVHGRSHNSSFIILESIQIKNDNIEDLHYTPEALVVLNNVRLEQRYLSWYVTLQNFELHWVNLTVDVPLGHIIIGPIIQSYWIQLILHYLFKYLVVIDSLPVRFLSPCL